MLIVLLALPLVTVIVIGVKLTPAETYRVTFGGCPEALVSRLVDILEPGRTKLPREPASVVIANATDALAAGWP